MTESTLQERLAKFPKVEEALAYSRNFARANPHLTSTAVEHIEGLADMLELTDGLLQQARLSDPAHNATRLGLNPTPFTEMLIGVIADVQRELGFTDEEVESANGSSEIVAAIRKLKSAPPQPARSPEEVWLELIEVLDADNGGTHEWTSEEMRAALPAIRALQELGFFADDSTDLESSFWHAAAGEETEAREFFMRGLEPYEALGAVLNQVFDREWPPIDSQVAEMYAWLRKRGLYNPRDYSYDEGPNICELLEQHEHELFRQIPEDKRTPLQRTMDAIAAEQPSLSAAEVRLAALNEAALECDDLVMYEGEENVAALCSRAIRALASSSKGGG